MGINISRGNFVSRRLSVPGPAVGGPVATAGIYMQFRNWPWINLHPCCRGRGSPSRLYG